MRRDAIEVEEARLSEISRLEDYPWVKERHRIFPAVFEDREHTRILDIAAGVGYMAERIHDGYPAKTVYNDIAPTALKMLRRLGVPTVSFDIDNGRSAFPFEDSSFDAVVSMVTVEHVINVDHHMEEICRVLTEDGYLYISTPNYAAPEYILRVLFSGRTFHNPLWEGSRYEFYAHVRYFTYRTLVEYVASFGFIPNSVYLALPNGSSRYSHLYSKARWKALGYRYIRWLQFKFLPVRWATEPVLCFRRGKGNSHKKPRKVVL